MGARASGTPRKKAATKAAKASSRKRSASTPQKRKKTGGNRGPDGKFVKGNRANPGGRPKSNHKITELARQHTELALRTLAEIAGDEEAPHSARVSACSALLDRGWGKPPQAMEVSGRDGQPLEVTFTIAGD